MGRWLKRCFVRGLLLVQAMMDLRLCWASLVGQKGRGCQRLSINGFSTSQSKLPHLEPKLSVVSPFL